MRTTYETDSVTIQWSNAPADVYGDNVLAWHAHVFSADLDGLLSVELAIDRDGYVSVTRLEPPEPLIPLQLKPATHKRRSGVQKLRSEMYYADGRSDALVFAVEHDGNAIAIHQQIAQVEQLIVDGLIDFPNGPAKLGASPRIYKEGYLAGLQYALRLLNAADE